MAFVDEGHRVEAGLGLVVVVAVVFVVRGGDEEVADGRVVGDLLEVDLGAVGVAALQGLS